MKPETVEHLATAARNRDVALALTDPDALGLQPPPLEWAAVATFYAAVHYANAYLWEGHAFVPRSHRERELELARHADFATALGHYLRAIAS
jgi:hypothetical protein